MDIQNLEIQYLKAKVAYYDGNPIMSDIAFDTLEKELKTLGSKVVEQVGSKRKDFNFPHPTPMRSLTKIQTESKNNVTNYQTEAFMSWLTKHNAFIGYRADYILYAPKFDGSAINIVYKNQTLQSIITRGDGKFGKDVTDRLEKHIPNILNLDKKASIIEIRCEAVMKKSVFKEKYANEYANPRNFVAGILGKDDVNKDQISDITLIPLHVIVDGEHISPNLLNEHFSDYKIFSRSLLRSTFLNEESYINAVRELEEIREEFDYPLDGIVFSFPEEYRKMIGENEHSPKWSIAIKFVADEVITSVEGIQWNLGKTGELTPVVLLKPVELAGTTVKRASGYNAGYIIKNKIGKGCIVSIAKAGDIIPEMQEIYTPGEVETLPIVCPVCGESLTYDGIHLMCNNENCEGRIAKKLAVAAGILDLKSIGGKTIEPFAKEFDNMYELMRWVLLNHNKSDFSLESFDIKDNSRSHEIFVNAFKNIKSLTYSQVILIMGYDGIGKKLSEQVAKEYCGLEPNYTSMERALVQKMKDPKIVEDVKNAVKTLESLGINIDKPINNDMNTNNVYACLTGSPSEFGWKTKADFLKQFSNITEVSVTDSKCQYLITDSLDSTTSKMKTAEKKGVKIITYNQFKNVNN